VETEKERERGGKDFFWFALSSLKMYGRLSLKEWTGYKIAKARMELGCRDQSRVFGQSKKKKGPVGANERETRMSVNNDRGGAKGSVWKRHEQAWGGAPIKHRQKQGPHAEMKVG